MASIIFIPLKNKMITLLLILPIIWSAVAQFADKPCNARAVANRSVVCVCTAEYCDTVIRETPQLGEYYAYTTSENGLRFNKTNGKFQASNEIDGCDITLKLDLSRKYQTIHGFGGAVTDSAGINYKNLTDPKLMEKFIESYCGSTGLQYSMLRVPIGGTDFSTHPYAYNELPENDITLSNFSLAYEDYEYKLPMIKSCMEASDAPINVLASLWSPPPWMKSNNDYTGFSRIKAEYFQTLADYFYKFIQKYNEEGISLWGITLTNEPLNGIVNSFYINSLGWNIEYLAQWVEYHLGPTIRNSTFKDLKILSGDDQRYTIPIWWTTLIKYFPGTYQYLDGLAVHFYNDKNNSASIMSSAMAEAPDKFLLYTEACNMPSESDPLPVDFGSWSRAENYIMNIIEDLNYNSTGWLDWNMCLNPEGGPTWIDNNLDSPVIINAEAGEFIKQPMFYAMGHFSKLIRPGSRRIDVIKSSEDVQNVAFITPDNNIVVVLYNESKEKSVKIQLGDKEVVIQMDEKSITTVEFPSQTM